MCGIAIINVILGCLAFISQVFDSFQLIKKKVACTNSIFNFSKMTDNGAVRFR
jgi:hypothetical protein